MGFFGGLLEFTKAAWKAAWKFHEGGLDPFHLGGLRSWLEFTKATWSFMMEFHEGNLEFHEGNLEFYEV